ncbi:LexA family protein [Enterococcus sp. AZ102]|uniref:LexA family protein n=1 Tax=Enterococcus sp. AZ102 TaxID=2774865 RepID=UPI003F25CBE9
MSNIIGKQISELRNTRGYTQEDLALKIGVSKQTVSNWETGLKVPRMGAIQKIADHFNVSKSFIIDGKDPIQVSNLNKVKSLAKIPVLGTITCGDPILAHENIESYIDEVEENLPSGELFYLKTQGDSMAPTIPQNSFVLIRKQEYVESGEIAAVIVNGDNEATLKRVKYQGDIVMLIPDNKAYEPIVITESNHARIIGKAVKVSINL